MYYRSIFLDNDSFKMVHDLLEMEFVFWSIKLKQNQLTETEYLIK